MMYDERENQKNTCISARTGHVQNRQAVKVVNSSSQNIKKYKILTDSEKMEKKVNVLKPFSEEICFKSTTVMNVFLL